MAERLQESIHLASGNAITNNANIEEIFKCFICLGKVVDAKLCPSCSKPCCNHCITRWLTEQRPQCPHCRAPLRLQNLVNGRIVSELSQALESLQISKPEPIEKCSTHSLSLNYYCMTCFKAICSDCAMFGAEHKGHEFQHLSTIHEKHVKSIKHKSSALRKRIAELGSILREIDINIEKVKKSKEEKSKELISTAEKMQERLEAQVKNKLQILHEQKEAISEEIDNLENMHIDINKQLSQDGKSKLIAKTPELIKMLKELNQKPLSRYNKVAVSTDIQSEITPSYDSGTFEIKNYSTLRATTEVIYSDTLQTGGITWRLKVYPNGNGVARDSYLSVFLEMMKGLQNSSKYEYRVEMVNHLSSNLCVVREFTSEFESGECWGYNRFFKIELLKEEGYLSEEDTISLRYYIRPPTYFQKCRDQKQYIKYLEASRNQLLLQLKEYQEKSEKKESEDVSVFDSNENPLEKIEEETKERPAIEEASKEESYKEESDDSFDKVLQKQIEIQTKIKEDLKSREEEISKEQSANSAHELSTVLQRYMMTPEEVSSSGSDSPREQKWSEGELETHSCSDILSHDPLDSEERDWGRFDSQNNPELLGDSLLRAYEALKNHKWAQ
ncbi:TRIM37_2 [Blepharisma stoltei]|uniref:Uncharacterized protein n=1 Tax=Blepharisma stoltei TaxID=1481888 RepID=A0AAU9IW80_9CILI|nr:unnamed protein product [Blepharisma stoltei]